MTTMKKLRTVPVSSRALVQRVNRKIRNDGRTLKIARSPDAISSVGKYFVIGDKGVTDQGIDLEAFARKLGVLAEWENVCD